MEEGRAGFSKEDKVGKTRGERETKKVVGDVWQEMGWVEARQTQLGDSVVPGEPILSPSLPRLCAEGSEVPLHLHCDCHPISHDRE